MNHEVRVSRPVVLSSTVQFGRLPSTIRYEEGKEIPLHTHGELLGTFVHVLASTCVTAPVSHHHKTINAESRYQHINNRDFPEQMLMSDELLVIH